MSPLTPNRGPGPGIRPGVPLPRSSLEEGDVHCCSTGSPPGASCWVGQWAKLAPASPGAAFDVTVMAWQLALLISASCVPVPLREVCTLACGVFRAALSMHSRLWVSHRVVKWLAWAPAALADRDQTCTQALGFQGSCSNHDATLPVASLWVQGVGCSHLRAPVTFLQELSWSSEVTPASPPRPCTSLLPRRPPHDLMQTAVDMAFPSPFWSRSPYPMPASPCCLGQSWHRAATACPPLPSRASLGFQLAELFETCPGS